MIDYQVDIAIVGGGLNGAALVHGLKATGLRVLMIDSQDFFKPQAPNTDARSLTLSIASLRILQSLGIWSELASTATGIHTIHVSEQGRFGTACLEAPDQTPLGYVVPIQNLVQALYQDMDRQRVLAPATVVAFDSDQKLLTVQMDDKHYTVQAKIVVAADGSQSSMRRFCQLPVQIKDYGQHALVTQINLARAHQRIAYERFTTSGPLAMLPLEPKRMGVVWSLSPEEATRISQMDDEAFLQNLTKVFGYRLGSFVGVGQRLTYPLRQMLMTESVQGPVVFIGNAAHTLHPVAGQGFNLGLRDVAMLAQMITQIGLDDPTLLTRYQEARQHDQTAIAWFTDGLISMYGHPNLGVRMVRQFGLLVLDNNRLLKRVVARYATGLGGVVPDLVCGIPL
ncbi:MAG: FAD-dependent monooxygenase [Gammaproteobacteria bacterium]